MFKMLIGILGKKCHGKDTVADFIVDQYSFNKRSFSDPLKLCCKVLFDFSDEQLYGDMKEEVDKYWNITPRHAMQYFGSTVIRDNLKNLITGIENNFWIEHFKKTYNYGNVVISDVRHTNEVDMIHQLGGIVIKVTRHSILSTDTHSSETEIDNIDTYNFMLHNKKSLEYLYDQIKYIMETELHFSVGIKK